MSPKIHYWQWPNLLAFDAAWIAMLWQAALAQALRQPLSIAPSLVLGLSVWLTYTADRLFDVAQRSDAQLLSTRHRFAKRHTRALWRIVFGILLLDITIALTGLSTAQLKSGALLLLVCLAYTALNQKLSRRFFPKEICVALIYTGGVVIFQAVAIPVAFSVFFALLCLLNCLMIGAKEKSIDAKMQVHSIAPIMAERWLGIAAFCLHLLVILIAAEGAIALSASFLALGCLHLLRRRLPIEGFRVLVDTALLLPPFIWIVVAAS